MLLLTVWAYYEFIIIAIESRAMLLCAADNKYSIPTSRQTCPDRYCHHPDNAESESARAVCRIDKKESEHSPAAIVPPPLR